MAAARRALIRWESSSRRSNAQSQSHFDAFPPGSRKIILTWIAAAKRPETRATRIAETVRLAAENRRANHFRP